MAKDATVSDSEALFLADLKQEFLETVSKNILDLQTLFAKGDFEEISKIAHDIKGTSGVFGLDEGSDIARELQMASAQGHAEKTKKLLEMLTEYMKKNGAVV